MNSPFFLSWMLALLALTLPLHLGPNTMQSAKASSTAATGCADSTRSPAPQGGKAVSLAQGG
ncbi:MAG: hypothetical protein ACREDR_13050, partial [Blastocatellia bacterium]